MPKIADSDAVLAQFNLLMEEILKGGLRRSKFQPWEIEILLDIETCQIPGSNMREILSEYQDLVQAELEKGARLPLKFSEFVERRERINVSRKPAKGSFPVPTKTRKRVR